jgi:hypothetical protein
LDFAPFRMIAKMQRTEMIDRFLDALAGADDKDAHGVCDRSARTIHESSNIHDGLLFLACLVVVRKPKNRATPRLNRMWDGSVSYVIT